jgi:hypothetical protein
MSSIRSGELGFERRMGMFAILLGKIHDGANAPRRF